MQTLMKFALELGVNYQALRRHVKAGRITELTRAEKGCWHFLTLEDQRRIREWYLVRGSLNVKPSG